jgi:predicted 2-oxoglutarate/Fe(II)-dependent dioxygenase YbiX
VHLNDDYEGGELQIWQPTWFEGDELPKGVVHFPGKKRGVAPVGTLTVFRSDFWHRVTPLITGTRYSLVVW